jgi:hypothetical protein
MVRRDSKISNPIQFKDSKFVITMNRFIYIVFKIIKNKKKIGLSKIKWNS